MGTAKTPFSDRVGKGRTLLGGFVPRKTRTLACRLPDCEEPAAAIAVCRTWDDVTNYYVEGATAYLEWPRIRESWLEGDVYHRAAVAEIDRQVEAHGEALFAMNEQGDASPWGLFVMAPHDGDRWKAVRRLEFKSASLGEAQT